MRLSNKAVLVFIIAAAAVLRFYAYGHIPFTHDEFSAVFRTNYDSFSQLIQQGIKIDGHPAGIQVFLYYWIKIFGSQEWIVKLPFTLAGITAIYLIYTIGKKWYNETTGLISAAFVASIQFTIMYSQIARPYISGLFFSLLLVNYWTNIIKTPDKKFYQNAAGFIIAGALCAYNHHFSLLFAAIVGLSGLFLIRKNLLFKYIIMGVTIFLLYSPHLHIFFYQLSIGGVEGWLSKPDNDFIVKFIAYIFNFSWLSFFLVLLIITAGLFNSRIKKFSFRKFFLFLLWFLLPLLIGYFYSIYVNAVLQFSVLIFSFPFLFFILFGHISKQKPLTNLIVVIVIFGINIFTLIHNRMHYTLLYHSPHENILLDHEAVREKYPNSLSLIDSHKKITRYYAEKTGVDTNFIWLDRFSSITDFRNYLENHSRDHNQLYLGCLSSNEPLTIAVILDYFPYIIQQHNYYGGTTRLFSKKSGTTPGIYRSTLDFESPGEKWSGVQKNNVISEDRSYLMRSENEWSPTFTAPMDELITHENNYIDISASINMKESAEGVILAASINSPSENIYWGGTPVTKFISGSDSSSVRVHHSVNLPIVKHLAHGQTLKAYFWNKEKESFLIHDMKIRVRKGNPYIYGLYEPIPGRGIFLISENKVL